MYVNEPLPDKVTKPVSQNGWMEVVTNPEYDWTPIGLDLLTEEYPGEVWAQHPVHDFMVSNYGRVLGENTSSPEKKTVIKRQYFYKTGSLKVETWKNGKLTQFGVSRLVWEAFRGEIPDGDRVLTTTNMPWDNRLTSLRLSDVPAINRDAADPQRLCLRGHRFVERNISTSHWRTLGYRSCRACNKARNRLNKARKRKGIAFTEDELKSLSDELYTKYTGLTVE